MSTPELEELIENETKQFMKLQVKGRNVRYKLDGTKTYDRYLGLCFFGGEDIGIFIIVSGLALNYLCYPNGHYDKYATEAKKKSIKQHKYCKAK